MADELVTAISQVQSTLLVASEEVFSVAAEARKQCPTVKASSLLQGLMMRDGNRFL